MAINMKNNQNKPIYHIASSFLVVLCLALTFISGCSQAPEANQEVAQAPQGEPIQGEPIQEESIEVAENVSNKQTNPSTDTITSETEENIDTLVAETSEEIKQPAPEEADEQIITTSKEEEASEASTTAPKLETNKETSSAEPEPQLVSNDTEAAKLLEQPLVPTAIEDADGFLSVTFDKLASFEYQMPEDLTEPVADNEGKVYKEQIPADIKALNLKNISLKGFMLPLKVEKGLVTEMLIMRDQSMCCYGTVPKINEWVSVRMKEEGVKPIMDEAVTIYGKLQVGEVLENGYLVGIYEMAGQKMDDHSAN